jgi:predicted phosphodiesterase
LNGPYLVAPTATSIVIAWELENPVKTELFYGTGNQWERRFTAVCSRGIPWKENKEGSCLYQVLLQNLQPATLYKYKICGVDGTSVQGSFQTLQTKTKEIHLVTLSDSHAFHTSAAFTAFVLQNRPDFIIHSGDISQGTGYQKEQYEKYWFQRCPELLRQIPVIYTDGNHDDGPFFGEYFTKVQSEVYASSPNGRDCSFLYGNACFIFVNSNAWGLAEMNAVNSGLPVAEEILQDIHCSLAWLEATLQSEAVKRMKWKIVVMHHPYTDAFANKRVVDIVEANNVNLVLSGHLHFYQKAVSVRPEIGAGILYITQGSAQDPAGAVDYGDSDSRILAEYPEIVATGKNVFHTLDITDEKLVSRAYGIHTSSGQPFLVDETVLVLQKPQIVLSEAYIGTYNEEIGRISFRVRAANKGRGLAQVVVPVEENGLEKNINLFGMIGKERVVVLDADEEKTVAGTIKLLTPGENRIRIANARTSVCVPEPAANFLLEHMEVRTEEENASDIVYAQVEITNLRKEHISASVPMYIDGNNIITKRIGLLPDECKAVGFMHRFGKGGLHRIAIGNLPSQIIEIPGALRGVPQVRDLSGRGNHGWIRGTPRVIPSLDDTVSLSLDGYGDYIEIPDSSSLTAMKKGLTGMVWANQERLAGAGEKDHNPMMVKGPSVGWGPNYLFRMIVRDNGAAGWGVCCDTNEYSFVGGRAHIGRWAQYMLSFDPHSSAKAYINNKQVGEAAGILPRELRYWDGYPIFVGYAYMGHIIKEIKRTKYFTHFPGKIQQVRVYSTALSQEENKYIYEHPGERGPGAENMLVWLDFKDIVTEGIHKTEWRCPVGRRPLYKAEKQCWSFKELMAEAAIPGETSIFMRLELSDDGEKIKSAKEIVLRHGQQKISLQGMPEAQYARITTRFHSIAGEQGTFTPELKLYRLMAMREQKAAYLEWATKTAWEQGSFTGAVGFEPLGRTRIIEGYTDVLH